MADLRRSLESAADRYGDMRRGLDDIHRRTARRGLARRSAALVTGIAVTALLIISVSQLRREPSEPQQPGPSPTPWITVIADDFENGASDWFEEQGRSYSLGYVGGGYEIEIRRSLDTRFVVQTGGTAYDDVRVRTHVRTQPDPPATGSLGGFAGVLCVSRSELEDAYIFAVDPSDGVWVIQKITAGAFPVEQLAAGTFTSLTARQQPLELIGRCRVTSPGTVLLTLRVGSEMATATDTEGFSTFRGFGMYLASRGGRVTAHFDDLTLEIPPSFQEPRSPSSAG